MIGWDTELQTQSHIHKHFEQITEFDKMSFWDPTWTGYMMTSSSRQGGEAIHHQRLLGFGNRVILFTTSPFVLLKIFCFSTGYHCLSTGYLLYQYGLPTGYLLFQSGLPRATTQRFKGVLEFGVARGSP